ncbi:MAG TPA: arsenate reductase (glutaredoxin) [Oscillatoriaceae cyanobacterium]
MINGTEAMQDVTIYHNPRCSKSRQALALLEEAGVQPRVVRYLETPLSVVELDALLAKLELAPEAVMRTGEDEYKALGLKGKALSRAEGLKILAGHPVLLERPIVVRGDRAVVARPPERVRELL